MSQGLRECSPSEVSGPLRVSARFGPPAALCLLWIAMIVAVDPIGDFPLNDDWAWGGAVRTLYEHHVLTMPGWADAAVIAQIVWGWLACLPFGFSFTVLRLATATLGLAAVLATYALAREAGASRWMAFLCGFAVAVNPLVFESSNTFMTDTPFLAFLLLSMLCFVRAARSGSPVTAILAIVLTLTATLTRQLGMLIPVVFVIGCGLARMVTLRSLLLAAVTGVVLREGLQLFESWLRATGQVSPNYGRLMKIALDRFWHPFDPSRSVFTFGDGMRMMVTYVGFFLLPVSVAVLPRRLRSAKTYLFVGGLLGAAFAWTANVELERRGWTMPFGSHFNLMDIGLGPATLVDVHVRSLRHLPRAAPGFWRGVTTLGLVGGGVAIMLCVVSGLEVIGPTVTEAGKPGKLVAAMTLAFALGYGVILAMMPFDRYFVPIFPMVLIAGVWGTEPMRSRGSRLVAALVSVVALVGLLLQAGFSVAATHDYLAWNRARWAGLHELVDGDGVTPAQIDGGFEFNGLYRYGSPTQPGKSPWVEDDLYAVTFGPLPGYATLREYSYRRWLPPGEGRVFVLVREGASARRVE